MLPRVVVTGLGMLTPFGAAEATWQALVQGRSGVVRLRPSHLPPEHQHLVDSLPSQVVGAIDTQALALREGGRAEPKAIAIAKSAASQALEQAGLTTIGDDLRQGIGVSIGMGMAGVVELAGAGHLLHGGPNVRKISPFLIPSILNNAAAGAVSLQHRLQGPVGAPSTACATGLHSIGEAFRMIRLRETPVVIAGGVDACVDGVALAGFSRMRALSTAYNGDPARSSRPFDAHRDGFVLAEGAGMLVMEDLEHARARGATPLAEVRGFGSSCDAHHVTQPSPDGSGAALSMHRALKSARTSPEDVSYVNAHATSTPLGDAAEARALETVFGGPPLRNQLPIVSSFKGALGHLLGGAGAVEAGGTVLALQHRLIPPNINLQEPIGCIADILAPADRPVRMQRSGNCLVNSFGFGGANASLVLGPVDNA